LRLGNPPSPFNQGKWIAQKQPTQRGWLPRAALWQKNSVSHSSSA
jgi:hypothetical protein